jgi:hypothetical protein
MAGELQGKGDGAPETSATLSRKPYRQPLLSNLGTLRDMTMATSGGGRSDGARPPFNKTGRGGRNGRGQSDGRRDRR